MAVAQDPIRRATCNATPERCNSWERDFPRGGGLCGSIQSFERSWTNPTPRAQTLQPSRRSSVWCLALHFLFEAQDNKENHMNQNQGFLSLLTFILKARQTASATYATSSYKGFKHHLFGPIYRELPFGLVIFGHLKTRHIHLRAGIRAREAVLDCLRHLWQKNLARGNP